MDIWNSKFMKVVGIYHTNVLQFVEAVKTGSNRALYCHPATTKEKEIPRYGSQPAQLMFCS